MEGRRGKTQETHPTLISRGTKKAFPGLRCHGSEGLFNYATCLGSI